VILVALVFSVSGCSKRYHELPAFASYPVYDVQNNSVGRFKTSYLADQIHAYFRGNISGPIAVVSFVDVDHLYGSSTFGRLLTEQLMSELSMRGYNVIELRQSSALQIAMGEGEFALSRELELMAQEQDVAGLVVGTYAVSPVRVYVNARIVDPATALVISAGSVEMEKTRELAKLLRNNSFPTSLERIPVRHLSYREFPEPYYRSNPAIRHNSLSGMEMLDDELFENQPSDKTHGSAPQPKLEPTT
jgi:TolB-like protein